LLLKPLSWSAIASASEGETPWLSATSPTSDGVTTSPVGCGPATGEAVGAAGSVAAVVAPGMVSVVPAGSSPAGFSEFAAASSDTVTPSRAAIVDYVSP
jgi:hypothetical protein